MKKYSLAEVAAISKTAPAPDPMLLCQPNIPKPLHGVAPRVIRGYSWWDVERAKAYESAGFCCRACGTPKFRVHGERRVLEAHECYDYDYGKGRLTFTGLVALCPFCHSFIHSGRLSVLLDAGRITRERYEAIVEHGTSVLRRAGLLKVWEQRHNIACRVRWQDWRLVFEGWEYGPSSRSMTEWMDGVWRNWQPTGKEKKI